MRLLKEESSLGIFVLVILCSAGEFNLLPFAQRYQSRMDLHLGAEEALDSAAC